MVKIMINTFSRNDRQILESLMHTIGEQTKSIEDLTKALKKINIGERRQVIKDQTDPDMDKEEHKMIFLCYWGDGYVGGPAVEIVGFDFFTVGKGYDSKDITEIESLKLGESYSNFDCGPHTVTRIG